MTVADGVVLRCSARFTDVLGSDNVNVWWYRTDFAAAQTDSDVFDAVDLAISSVYQPFDGRVKSLTSVHDLKVDVVQHIAGRWSTVQNVGFGSFGSTIVFADTGEALPPGVSPVVFLYTGLGKHQGRKFLFGFTEGSNDAGGNMPAAPIVDILSGFTTLLTPHVISAGNQLVAVVADQAAGITRDIVEVAASAVFGYQRRRRPGRGS